MNATCNQLPTIAAHVGVKNEVDLVGRLLDYLPSIGIEHILVTDISSSDGTQVELERRKSETLWVQRLPDECISGRCPHEDGWERKTQSFVSQTWCDWVLFLDADEFPLTLRGDLRTTAKLANSDVISLERYNVPVTERGPWMPSRGPLLLSDIYLILDPVPDMREHLRRYPWTPWIMAKVLPKVMVRTHLMESLDPGCHDVRTLGHEIRRSVAKDVVIAHLPISTLERARGKSSEIAAFFRREGSDIEGQDSWLNNGMSWHWRRLALLRSLGKTDEEYNRNVFDAYVIEQMLDSGRIRSAQEWFRQQEEG